MKRWLKIAVLILVIATVVPFLPADLLRWRIEGALERSLGRKVDIEKIQFTLLPGPYPGPGFTLSGVTIHEDPRAGIEPFAHVGTLGARLSLWSLVRGHLEFTLLNLTDDAAINLVKTSAGPWNFQFLQSELASQVHSMPGLRVRGGRVNFKFGDTKSVFYFNDADLNVTPFQDGSIEVRFGGAPSRTDRAAQSFGRFFVRGIAAAGNERLDFTMELERSPLDDTLRLIDPGGFGVQGAVTLEARLSGPPSHLDVNGDIELADLHRWDLLPKGDGWRLGYTGFLDLHGERLDLQSTTPKSGSPLVMRFRAWDFLKTPHWDAGADVQQVPLVTLLEVARHMGVSLPEEIEANGSVSGSLSYNQNDGITGSVAVRDASLKLPNAEPLEAPVASIGISRDAVRIEPTTVHFGNSQSAELAGTYGLQEPQGLDVKITTRGLDVEATRSFGLTRIPVMQQVSSGTWRGWTRYSEGAWTGEFELKDARVRLEGLASPVQLQSAAASISAGTVAINRFRGKAGNVGFTGDYRWESDAVRPHKLKLKIAEADVADLQAVLAPTISREGGFISRTLRLGAEPAAPTWLKNRRVDGTITIDTLSAGELNLANLEARVLWDGTRIHMAGLRGAVRPAAFSGDLDIDLAGTEPAFHAEGHLDDVAFKDGQIDLDGVLDSRGIAAQLIENLRAEGTLRGHSIVFAPDAEFRTASAAFELQGLRWKLSNIEVNQDGDAWTGTGATQTDGRLVLDLASKGRQMRYTGSLFASGTFPF